MNDTNLKKEFREDAIDKFENHYIQLSYQNLITIWKKKIKNLQI